MERNFKATFKPIFRSTLPDADLFGNTAKPFICAFGIRSVTGFATPSLTFCKLLMPSKVPVGDVNADRLSFVG
jgi:hypothetical protein